MCSHQPLYTVKRTSLGPNLPTIVKDLESQWTQPIPLRSEHQLSKLHTNQCSYKGPVLIVTRYEQTRAIEMESHYVASI
jgi:hypothetical protein